MSVEQLRERYQQLAGYYHGWCWEYDGVPRCDECHASALELEAVAIRLDLAVSLAHASRPWLDGIDTTYRAAWLAGETQ